MLGSISYDMVIQSIIIFSVFYLVSAIIARLLKRASRHHDINASAIFRLLSNSQRALLLLIGAIIAISKLGFDMSAIIAGLGLTGFAVGLALKDTISNLVAGIIIVLYKPFSIGDQIDISGVSGTVNYINLRYVSVQTEKGENLVPNSYFLNKVLTLKNSKVEE
jgi:small conductance mechanosensitive channel